MIAKVVKNANRENEEALRATYEEICSIRLAAEAKVVEQAIELVSPLLPRLVGPIVQSQTMVCYRMQIGFNNDYNRKTERFFEQRGLWIGDHNESCREPWKGGSQFSIDEEDYFVLEDGSLAIRHRHGKSIGACDVTLCDWESTLEPTTARKAIEARCARPLIERLAHAIWLPEGMPEEVQAVRGYVFGLEEALKKRPEFRLPRGLRSADTAKSDPVAA